MKTLAFLIEKIDKSKESIRYAASFAKDINANLHVVHFQYPMASGSYGYMGSGVPQDPEMLQKHADEVKITVDEYIRDIEAEKPGIPFITFKSELGIASEVLEDKVAEGVYDIVMLQGQGDKDYWLQNSEIMDIVRNVPCPAYIIPPDIKYQPLKKIIYATDHNEEDITTLKSLFKLAKPFDPEIMAIHISSDDNFERKLKSEGFAEIVNKKAASKNISVKMIADKVGSDAVEKLINEAEKARTDLIVVLKENRNFFERIFKSSFTAELIKKVQLPVLVFHKSD